MSNITITWNGHSCFTISAEKYSIVLDPYAPDSVPGLAPLSLTANQVLCSHDHRDHGYTEAVTILPDSPKNPFNIFKIDTFHDDERGALRGPNRIHILEMDGLKVAHMGDLGCMLDNEKLEQLKNMDAVLIPVGGYYTIDAHQAKELISRLSPRVVIPMHYRSDTFGYPVIDRLEVFTNLCRDVIIYDTNTIRIDENTKCQTAVLKLV